TPCQTEADATALCGTASQIQRLFLRFAAIDTVSSLHFLPVTSRDRTSGATTSTLATAATSGGNHRFGFNDQFDDTSINTGDTAIVVAGNIVTSINAQTRWPVTAANSGTA